MKIYFLMIWYGLYMILEFFRGGVIFFLKRFSSKETVDRYVKEKYIAWARFSMNILNHKIESKGVDNIPEGPCVFVMNHQSLFDIPALVLNADRLIGFIAKKELLKVPILGLWLRAVHSVPIDRSNIREAINVINKGVENLHEGYSMAIFPEGTRAKDGKLKDFKKGSLKLATKANVPIVPVTIDGSYKGYEESKKFRGANIKIIFDEPIYPEKLTKEEQRDLAEIIHDKIEENLKKMRA